MHSAAERIILEPVPCAKATVPVLDQLRFTKLSNLVLQLGLIPVQVLYTGRLLDISPCYYFL